MNEEKKQDGSRKSEAFSQLKDLEKSIDDISNVSDGMKATVEATVKETLKQVNSLEPSTYEEIAGSLGDAVSIINDNLDNFKSDDTATVISGALGVISGITLLAPPPDGQVVSAAFGLASGIVGMFGSTEDPGEQMRQMVQDIVDRAVATLINKLEEMRMQELKQKAKGCGKVYTESFAYVTGLTECGLHKLTDEDRSIMVTNVPIYNGSQFLGELGSAIKDLHESDDYDKKAAAVNLLPLYTRLAVLRDLLCHQILCVWGTTTELFATYNAYLKTIQSFRGQSKAVISAVNPPNVPLWFADVDQAKAFQNVRAFQQMLGKDDEKLPEKKIDTFEKVEERVGDIRYKGMVQIVSDLPLVGMYLYSTNLHISEQTSTRRQGIRVDLGGIAPVSVKDNIASGIQDIRNEFDEKEIAQNIMETRYIDENIMMVDDCQTQAIYGASLCQFKNRLGIKIYYGNVGDDGTGTGKKWKEPSEMGEYMTDTNGWYKDVISYTDCTGYIVGVKLFEREKGLALRLWKTTT